MNSISAIRSGWLVLVLTMALVLSACGEELTDEDINRLNNSGSVPPVTSVTPSSGLVTNEGGVTAQFTVVLNFAPTGDVTIPVRSGNTGEGTVSPASLTFTTVNWATPQVVTVTGADDGILDGQAQYTVFLDPATSTDPAYNGADSADVSVLNADNELAWMVVGTPLSNLTTAAALSGVTLLQTSDLAVADLSNVGVLIFQSGSGASFVKDGATLTKISNFVAAGGGLYVELGGQYDGAAPLDYSWVPNPGIVSTIGNQPSSNLINITDPFHPTMSGVSPTGLDNWNSTSHGDFTATGGLAVIALNGDTGLPVLLAGTFVAGRAVYSNLDTMTHTGSGDSVQHLTSTLSILMP